MMRRLLLLAGFTASLKDWLPSARSIYVDWRNNARRLWLRFWQHFEGPKRTLIFSKTLEHLYDGNWICV